MKITDVKVETIRIPMKKPFRIAFAVQDHSLNVLVKISTDEGLWGIGEAAPFEPVTGESAATVLEALKLFRTGLIGMDPLDVEGIHRMMDRLLSGNTSAKAAVDIALYDIKGKLMGQPLYKVLGGSVNQIVTDMTVGIDTPEAMAAEARERVEKDGFTILKIKAGINPSEDIQALTLIRQAVGPNIRLRVDANQGYTVSDAVRTLKAFEELGVEAVEQCLPSWDLDGMRFVRSKVDLKVMLDESVHTPIDAAKACKIDAADIINIKLMKCGGLYPAEKINHCRGKPCTVHGGLHAGDQGGHCCRCESGCRQAEHHRGGLRQLYVRRGPRDGYARRFCREWRRLHPVRQTGPWHRY